MTNGTEEEQRSMDEKFMRLALNEARKALAAEEADILAFDASFPEKEKKVLPCQQEYEIACAQLDE